MSETKKICTLSMLIAISVVLGAYLTVRIGGGIKITFKFATVFISARLFGPIAGGAVGIISDIVSYLLSPTGAFLPPVSAIEFIYGFIFGIMFYKKTLSIPKIIFCAALQMLVINLFITSYVLKPFFGNNYITAVFTRLPTAFLNMAIQTIVLIFFKNNKLLGKAVNKIG